MKKLLLLNVLFLLSTVSYAQNLSPLGELENIETYEVHDYAKYKSLTELTKDVESDSIKSLLFHDQSKFPTGLGKLKNLQSVEFYSCEDLNYSDLLKECLKLNHLIELTLSGLSEQEFPLEIYQLTKLKKLTLAGNNFKTLPTGLDKLSNLEILILGDHLTGGNDIQTFPQEIVNLKNLRILSLVGNTELILDSNFYGLHQLEELNLSFVSNLDFNKTCNSFPNLKKLIITGIDQRTWEGISGLSQLEFLSMDYDSELHSLGKDFSKLSNLETLDIHIDSQLNFNEEIAKIAALPKLKSLSLTITNREKFELPTDGFKSLRMLRIDNRTKTSISQVIEMVSQYPSLERLDLMLRFRNLTHEEEIALQKLSETIEVVGLKN
ncbi:MAG: hypothetical protein R2852_04365 [Bacteroidia bacterium]